MIQFPKFAIAFGSRPKTPAPTKSYVEGAELPGADLTKNPCGEKPLGGALPPPAEAALITPENPDSESAAPVVAETGEFLRFSSRMLANEIEIIEKLAEEIEDEFEVKPSNNTILRAMVRAFAYKGDVKQYAIELHQKDGRSNR